MSNRSIALILAGFCLAIGLVIGVPGYVISNGVSQQVQPTASPTGKLETANTKKVEAATANGEFAAVSIVLIDPATQETSDLSADERKLAIGQVQDRFLARVFAPDFKVTLKREGDPIVLAQLNALGLDRVLRSKLVTDVILVDESTPTNAGP